MQGEGDRTDLATLIQEQSDLKVRVIDGPGYSFPPRLKSSDWWGTAILAVAMLDIADRRRVHVRTMGGAVRDHASQRAMAFGRIRIWATLKTRSRLK